MSVHPASLSLRDGERLAPDNSRRLLKVRTLLDAIEESGEGEYSQEDLKVGRGAIRPGTSPTITARSPS